MNKIFGNIRDHDGQKKLQSQGIRPMSCWRPGHQVFVAGAGANEKRQNLIGR